MVQISAHHKSLRVSSTNHACVRINLYVAQIKSSNLQCFCTNFSKNNIFTIYIYIYYKNLAKDTTSHYDIFSHLNLWSIVDRVHGMVICRQIIAYKINIYKIEYQVSKQIENKNKSVIKQKINNPLKEELLTDK